MTDRPPKRPFVFIGSSAEGLPIAKAIQSNLDHTAECQIWSQGHFGLTSGTLETLVNKLDDFDFAILVLTPADLVISRGETHAVPRDNVLLELGLFIGYLGRERTFMVCQRDANMKLPTDLAGITPAHFQQPSAGNLQSALGTATTAIEDSMNRVGMRKPDTVWLKSGYYFDTMTAGGVEQGYALTVGNGGTATFPPFNVVVFHPQIGRFNSFRSDVRGELLVDQRRMFKWKVFVGDSLCFPARMLTTKADNTTLNDAEMDQYCVRLVLDHSDKILFESREIGAHLARAICQAAERGHCFGAMEPS